MTIASDDIWEAFLQFEDDADVYDVRLRESPVWERIRVDVFHQIAVAYGEHESTDSDTEGSSRWDKALHAGKAVLRGLGRHNPYLTGQHDLLVVGHQRRKQFEDGYWWDIYTDPLYQALDLDVLHAEVEHKGGHKTPAKTSGVRYLEVIRYLGYLWKEIGVGVDEVGGEELDEVRELERAVEAYFDVDVQITDLVRSLFTVREPAITLYTALLRRVDPSVVVVLVSYGREWFIEACKRYGVPVVELQHGVVHPHHFAYAFPGDRTKENFPDYLLTYGEFWNDVVEYPIPDERVIPVGYPHLERRAAQYENVATKEQIVFISEPRIGTALSRLAVRLSDLTEHDIVYKLHPNETEQWRERYPWLTEANVTVVDSDQPPLYSILAESSIQVGVGSTALYEGLMFGLETYIFDVSDTSSTDPLVEEGYASKISSAGEITPERQLDAEFEPHYFFRLGSIARIDETLREIAETHR